MTSSWSPRIDSFFALRRRRVTKEGGDYGGNFAERRRKFSGRRNWVVILASGSRKRGEEIKRDPERGNAGDGDSTFTAYALQPRQIFLRYNDFLFQRLSIEISRMVKVVPSLPWLFRYRDSSSSARYIFIYIFRNRILFRRK